MNADSKYFDKYYDYVNRGIQPETKELELPNEWFEQFKNKK